MTDTAQDLMTRKSPLFNPSDLTVIFVLGGPGSGKGTQCQRLVSEYGFLHLSAGDLLRAEQERKGSSFGELIASYIREGQIVPQEITIALLENAIREHLDTGTGSKDAPPKLVSGAKVLIDGFPRKMDQAHLFDSAVCPSSFVLFLDCTEEIMLRRLLHRGETSGRADDNVDSIKKRFRTFVDTSMPVVDYYRQRGKVVEVDSTVAVETVTEEINAAFAKRGIEPVSR